jgi:hypothetical protein
MLNISVLRLEKHSLCGNDIAMNNEEQDVKKKIMMVVGACIFLIAAAQALPMFFGLS